MLINKRLRYLTFQALRERKKKEEKIQIIVSKSLIWKLKKYYLLNFSRLKLQIFNCLGTFFSLNFPYVFNTKVCIELRVIIVDVLRTLVLGWVLSLFFFWWSLIILFSELGLSSHCKHLESMTGGVSGVGNWPALTWCLESMTGVSGVGSWPALTWCLESMTGVTGVGRGADLP